MLVIVVMAHPREREIQPLLIPTFGAKIKIMIRGVHHIKPPAIGRIGVEHIAFVILEERADSVTLGRKWFDFGVVVVNLPFFHFLWSNRNMVVEVKIRAEGGHPL